MSQSACGLPGLLAARFPGFVRAAVIADPGSGWGDDIRAYNEAAEAFFALCNTDAVCHTAFPDLRQFVLDQYQELQQQPALVTTQHPFGGAPLQVLIDGDANVLITLLALQFVSPGEITVVVHADPAKQLNLAAAFLVEHQDLDPSQPGTWGASLSEYCENEYFPGLRTGVASNVAQFPLFAGFARDPNLEVCGRWPTKERSTGGTLAPADLPPGLVITGALDPFAPASYAEAWRTDFDPATVAVFPTLSAFALLNGPPCIGQLRLDFLRDPQAKLDVEGCIASVPPIEWQGT